MDIDVVTAVIILASIFSYMIGVCVMLVPYRMLHKENKKLKRQLEELVRLEDLSSQAYRMMVWEAARNYQPLCQDTYLRR